jgi:phosphate uptake regulator
MVTDAVGAMHGKGKELGEEVVQRDDEVDRFYHFILRQLNTAVRDRSVIQEIGLSSPRDCLGYRLAAKSAERVADHAASIASQAEYLQALPDLAAKKVQEMANLSKKVFESSITALLRLDAKVAEEAISKAKEVVQLEEKLTGETLAPKMTGGQAVSIRVMLEDIRRVAEYGADISEIAIDLTVKEPFGSR